MAIAANTMATIRAKTALPSNAIAFCINNAIMDIEVLKSYAQT